MSYEIVFLTSAEKYLKELRSYSIKKFSLAIWQDTYIHIVADTRKDMKKLLTQRLMRSD